MLLHLLETYDPQEIIIPHTMEGSSLHTQLQGADHGFIQMVKRHHYNDNKGLEQVRKLATVETRCVVKSCEQKYLALSVFRIIKHYSTCRIREPESLVVCVHKNERLF